MASRKYKQLLIQPYGYWLRVFSDWEAYKKEVQGKTTEPPPDKQKPLGKTTLLSRDNQRLLLIYAEDAATLTHEFMHAVLMIFEEIKSDPREGNGEPAAYLISHMWEQIVGRKRFKV